MVGDYTNYGIGALLGAAGVAAAIFVAFVLWIKYRKYQNRQYLLRKIRGEWGQPVEREYSPSEYESISHYYLNREYSGWQVDDITWNDLDMDKIFCHMNHTRSFLGESYLYYRLRTPQFSGEELESFEELISWFDTHEREREEMEYYFAQIGRYRNIPVFDYIYSLPEADTGGSNLIHYGMILLLLCSITLLFIYPQPGILLLIADFFAAMSIYERCKRPIRPYITSCNAIERILKGAEGLLKQNVECLPREKMQASIRAFAKLRRNMVMLTAGESQNGGLEQTVFLYLNWMLHIDLMQFKTVVRETAKHMPELEYLVDVMGRIEAAIAVASFRRLHPQHVVPVLHEKGPVSFAAKEMYHPLIETPVANTIDTNRSVLLTGSNASGKSTFLKTAALQALLAQTVHTVTAAAYEARYFRIYSSMALRDDLVGEESYYMVEIRSLKRILDRLQEKEKPKKVPDSALPQADERTAGETCVSDSAPVLCCVDEVLRGTNTVERISASSQILKWMAGKNVICLAATHDIELTWILEGIFRNCHFEEQVTDDAVAFDYKLREGRAMTRNAIRLLHLMGFEDEIIQSAEAMAEELAGSSRKI